MPPVTGRPLLVALSLSLAACADPPDDTPLGREAAAVLARPEAGAATIKVRHVLVAFVGAKRGSESGRDKAAAMRLAAELLQRARGGEDFAGLMKQYSGDDGPGTYTLTPKDRDDYATWFTAIAYRLQVGEFGVAPYHRSKSPFGWHVIQRLE